MKINEIDLKKAYATYVQGKKPSSRKSCPSIEMMRDSFGARFSRKKKTEIVAHMTNCSSCVREFTLLANLSKPDRRLETEARKLGESIRDCRETRVRGQSEKMHSFPFFASSFWKYAAVLTMLVIAGSSLFLITRNPLGFGERGSGFAVLDVVGPGASTFLSKSPLFKWKEIPEYEYYVLELLDESLAPVWKSSRISKGQYTIPDIIWLQLRKKENYFWTVSAYQADKKRAESKLHHFSLGE